MKLKKINEIIYLWLIRIDELLHNLARKYIRPKDVQEFQSIIGERLIEYAFIVKNLKGRSGKVLEVGCVGSYLPTILSVLGFNVYGLDIQHYPLTYPNFTFIKS